MIQHKQGPFILRVGIVCLGILLGWYIYTIAIQSRNIFTYHWDETAHALKGILIAYDVQNSDWLGFLYDSYRQVYWPPLQSWFLVLSFTLTEPTVVAARTTSLVFYLLGGSSIYMAGRTMRQQNREIIGFVAAVLFLTNLWITSFAIQVMLEIYGILFLIISFWLVFLITKHPEKSRFYFLLSLTAWATYFAKTNYGIVLFVAILMATLIDVKFRLRELWTRQVASFLIPASIIFVIWFAYPAKIESTLQAMINYSVGVANPYSVEGFLFYPRALVELAGSPWLFLVWVSAFVISFWFWRDKNVRFLLIFAMIQLFIGQAHQTKVIRNHILLLPVFFLLTGYLFAYVWAWGQKGYQFWLPKVGLIVLISLSLFVFFSTYPSMIKDGSTDNELLLYLGDVTKADDATLIVGAKEVWNPTAPMIDWELITKAKTMQVVQSGTTMNFEQDQAAIGLVEKIPVRVVQESILSVLQRAEAPGNWSVYLGLPAGSSYSSSSEGLASFLKSREGFERVETVVVLSRLDDSGNYPESFSTIALENLGFSKVDSRDFVHAKATLYQIGD